MTRETKNEGMAIVLFATAALCVLAGLMGFVVLAPNPNLGRVTLTAEGCASVKLAGGNPQLQDGVCVVSGRYHRMLSGWTNLTLPTGKEVTLSSRAVLMVADDDSVRTPEDAARERRGILAFGGCLIAAALCLLSGIRISRRKEFNREGKDS